MRDPLFALLILLVCPTHAAAEERLSPDQFEALSQGRTLSFSRDGKAYGLEQYLANRQVIWRFENGECSAGFWFARDLDICFSYETNPVPLCWAFVKRDGEHFARTLGTPKGDPSELRLTGEVDGPLDCPAANLGV